jgi:hypothetical protein
VYGVNGNDYTTSTSTITKVVTKHPGLPKPTCSVNPSDCSYLYKSYQTSYSDWERGIATYSEPVEPDFCSLTIPTCGQCTIFAREAKLLYFPVPSTSRDMCASQPTPFALPSPGKRKQLHVKYCSRLIRSQSGICPLQFRPLSSKDTLFQPIRSTYHMITCTRSRHVTTTKLLLEKSMPVVSLRWHLLLSLVYATQMLETLLIPSILRI